MISTANRVVREGWLGVLINHRGCSGTEIKATGRRTQMYHAGSTDDTSTAMTHIRQQYKGTDIFALGFSLGSNMLVKYMAERGERCEFKAAMSICNPFNFVRCYENVERKLFGVYNYALIANLKRKLYEHQHALSSFLEHHHEGDDI